MRGVRAKRASRQTLAPDSVKEKMGRNDLNPISRANLRHKFLSVNSPPEPAGACDSKAPCGVGQTTKSRPVPQRL